MISNTSKLVSVSIKQSNDKILERVFQSPYVSFIENMWLKSHACASKTYFNLLHQICLEEPSNIQPDLCHKLINIKKSVIKGQLAENINQIFSTS